MFKRTILLILAILILCVCDLLSAQSLHRCVGGNGEVMYSDRPCQNVVAEAHDGMNFRVAEIADYQGVCPLNPKILRARINRAFVAHDYVALSGLFIWDETDKDWIDARMFELRGLVKLTPISIQFDLTEDELEDYGISGSNSQSDLNVTSSDEELLALKPSNESDIVTIPKAELNLDFQGELIQPQNKNKPSRLLLALTDEKKIDSEIFKQEFILQQRGDCWWAGFDRAQ